MFKQIRREKEISQVDLAKAVGCTQAQISNWESGNHPIPEKYRIELMKVLSCHIPPHVPKTRGRKRGGDGDDTITVSFHLTPTQWIELKTRARDSGLSMVKFVVSELGLGE